MLGAGHVSIQSIILYTLECLNCFILRKREKRNTKGNTNFEV